MRKTEQRGHIYKEFGSWFVRYRDLRVVNGELKRVRLRKELGNVSDLNTKQAKERARELLSVVNKPNLSPETAVRFTDFVEKVYLPRLEQRTRPSTMRGYGIVWGQVKPYSDRLWIREIRTKQAQDILDALAATGRFNINSLRHIKSFLSGAFKLALQQGFYEGPNPIRETSIAGVRPASETHAYSLEEIEAMLRVLPEPASTVIMVAALTGCRRGEIRGMTWENYRQGEMLIARSVWQGHVTDPKSAGSKKPIPIIGLLATRLEAHRLRLGNPSSGPIFPNEAGKPTDLNNILNRAVLPVLRAAKMQWHGWHGFRRGLGTNLYRLGVSDKTIQQILRHADVSTTTGFYIKTASEDARAGMEKLENSLVARKWPEFSTVAVASEVVN